MKSKQKLLDIVYKILRAQIIPRDCDYQLIYFVLEQGYSYRPDDKTARMYLQDQRDGRIPSEDTIKRCRRKLQEEHPELRGSKWNDRHREEIKIAREVATERKVMEYGD